MSRWIMIAAAMSVGAGWAYGAAAQDKPAQLYERTVASEVRAQISTLILVKTDCSTGGDITVKVTAPAKSGTIDIEPGLVVPAFAKDSIYFGCNGKPAPGVKVFYKGNAGFVGADRVELDVFYPNGTYRRNRFLITVK